MKTLLLLPFKLLLAPLKWISSFFLETSLNEDEDREKEEKNEKEDDEILENGDLPSLNDKAASSENINEEENLNKYIKQSTAIYETSDKYFVTIEIPSLSEETLVAEVKGKKIKVSGLKVPSIIEKEKNTEKTALLIDNYKQPLSGKFEVFFDLFSYINTDKAEIKYDNGVLFLEVGKLNLDVSNKLKLSKKKEPGV